MRPAAAVLSGAVVAAAAALVLGDYPLSGSVPWVAALLIPLLIGVAMTLVDSRHRTALWAATGPLAAASVGWGVWIASGRGLDPVPSAAWVAIGLALVWPPSWAAFEWRRRTGAGAPAQIDQRPID